EVARLAPLRPSRADTMMDTARPTRTPRAIATIVSTVVTRVVVPVLSPWSKAATPTRPRAPGTRSQNAGVKLTIAGGPVRCRATRSATGVITAAPTKADSKPPKNSPPQPLAAIGHIQDQEDPAEGARTGAQIHHDADAEHADGEPGANGTE